MTEEIVQATDREAFLAKEAKRKRDARARKKVEQATAASKDELNSAETVQEFWAISLRGVDSGKLADWMTRQEYVELLLADVRTVLEGRSPDEEFVDDVEEEIRSDIAEHGVAGVTVPLLIGPFWKDLELLAKLTRGDGTPSTIFARFGVLIAVDDYNLHKWEQFIASHRRSKQPRVEIPTYVPLRCSTCNAPPVSS